MRKEFQFNILNGEGMLKAVRISDIFDKCMEELEEVCQAHVHSHREFSLVRTKLEEACFFAKKAMALQPDNCK